MANRKCSQCGKQRAAAEFLSTKPGAQCSTCRERKREPAQRWRHRTPATEPLRVRFRLKSDNRKLGPIPVSTSSSITCPKSCAWWGGGCYAELGWMGGRWKRVPELGITWEAFCDEVAKLPRGTLWRHNDAGDLPGDDENVDVPALFKLVSANAGRRGFTFTHKRQGFGAMRVANRHGFTINLSCDSIAEADALFDEELPLAVVVETSENRPHFLTPGGHMVTLCPAQRVEGVTCKSCRLCANGRRKTIIAFRAHGSNVVAVNRKLRVLNGSEASP